jgi:hypothetical protein
MVLLVVKAIWMGESLNNFVMNNTISTALSINQNQTQNPFSKSDVYQLTCPDCSRKYDGQTERSFPTRFQEHFHDFKYNNCKSKLAIHLIEEKHSTGHINDIMGVLYTTTKGKLMDTIEGYHIYKETHNNNQINDKNTIKPNAIFDILV